MLNIYDYNGKHSYVLFFNKKSKNTKECFLIFYG